jgi:hypothetical protein
MPASVTIAIPTRNRLHYLRAAVDSAMRALGPHDQVVISDNCSTDETPTYLTSFRDPRVTVLRQLSDLGMVGNWNACLAVARGERFMLLSDDDLVEPHVLSALGPSLDAEDVAFVYGRARVIDEYDVQRTLGHIGPDLEAGEEFLQAWFRYERTIYPCAALFRTLDLQRIGGFEPTFGPFADVGAWLGVWRSAPHRKIAFKTEIVASYRAHDGALASGSPVPGVNGIHAVASRFAEECGPHASEGFAAIAAHHVSSALRRQARPAARPLLAYMQLVLRNLPLVAKTWRFSAYWRQATILANPGAYERRKQRQAAQIEAS